MSRLSIAMLLAALTLVLVGGSNRDESSRVAVRATHRGHHQQGVWARLRTAAVGRSSTGGRIEAVRFGNPHAVRRILVIGCIHGDECAGRAVVRRLLADCPPLHVDIWAVANLNPDGRARGIRLNGRGVDLNRNFSAGWRPNGRRWDPEYAGPHPFSEPETRIARRLVRSLRPDVTIWYHQQGEAMVRAWGASVVEARRFARAVRMPFHRLRWLPGTAPNWQNHRFPGTSSFVVELPRGPLDARVATLHASAIKRLHWKRPLVFAHSPYMGVACKTPNSIACDRVGLAVFLPKGDRASRVTASINGRPVAMHIPAAVPTHGIYFEGFLEHAGLENGALRVTASRPASATVRITAHYEDGSTRTATRRVGLAPGWG